MVCFTDPAFGSSSTPVSSNIRHYLAQATLPKLRLAPCTPRMPSENHKTHRNNLSIRPERYRRLRYIHRVKRDYLDKLCLDFIQKHTPQKPVQTDADEDPDGNEQPSIPCAGFDVEAYIPKPVRHIDGLGVMWLECNILSTARAVLAMVPEYHDIVKSYSFTSNDIMRDEDQQIFRYFIWERSEDAETTSDSSDRPAKFILAYQPPWILGPRDMELFVDKKLKHLPSYDTCLGSGQQRYHSTHKLWAKIWDVCKMHDCYTFVLTNYNQWVFGGFSKGWENGYTTGLKEAYPSDTKGSSKPDPKGNSALPRRPTILEYLVYWTVSSMDLPDSFNFPPVPGEIIIETAVDDSIDDSLPPSLIPTHPDFPAPSASQPTLEDLEPSESEWSTESSDVPSSAGVRLGPESDSGYTCPPFLADTWRLPTKEAMEGRNESKVRVWIDETEPPPSLEFGLDEVPIITRAPSPVRSEWSDRSLATRYPHRHQGFYNMDVTIVEEVCEYDFDDMDLA